MPLVEKDVVTENNSNQSNNNRYFVQLSPIKLITYNNSLLIIHSNHSGNEKKSTRAQVESLAKDRGLKMDFVFTKPPDFVYRIG